MEISPDSEDVNVFRFCGEYFDTETGTVYLRARYYQASIGRFISRDSFSGKKSDPLSLNLYTYCRNNPISYADPSGYSYATLPNGKRMSINSASDAKLFNELKSGKSQSSQVKTTTPIIQDSPITGGITTQQSTTTYTTIQTTEQFYASQKKNTDIFSQINKGLNWFDKHITTPFIDSTVKFGKAVYHSTSLEIGGGFGFGAEGKLGAVNGSLLVVPIRDEYIIADDCKTNMTSKFSANAEFGEIIGAYFTGKILLDKFFLNRFLFHLNKNHTFYPPNFNVHMISVFLKNKYSMLLIRQNNIQLSIVKQISTITNIIRHNLITLIIKFQ